MAEKEVGKIIPFLAHDMRDIQRVRIVLLSADTISCTDQERSSACTKCAFVSGAGDSYALPLLDFRMKVVQESCLALKLNCSWACYRIVSGLPLPLQ